MVEVLKTSSQLSSFIRLTDYVDSEKLIHLSADELHGIVCGRDGRHLDHISKVSGARIEFVAKPYPGFQILAADQKSFRTGCAEGLRVVHAIRTASMKAAASVVSEPINGLLPTPVIPRKISAARPLYHPLYSDVSSMPTYAPVMLVVPGAILPTPETSPSIPPMSPEICMQIIKSPYLAVARRRKTLDNLKEHAKSRIAPQSPESCPPINYSCPEDQLLPPPALSAFDDEIADCLPGVPGARQSKEYKKLRRKISEIDDLVASDTLLDYCQKIKVDRRPLYLDQIRSILKGEVIQQEPMAAVASEDKPSPSDPQEDTCETVSTTPLEPVSPIPLLIPVIRKKTKKRVAQKKELTKLSTEEIFIEISLWQKILDFLCLLISFIPRRVFIHSKH